MQSLGPDDDGKQLRLACGESFAASLPETPTTGFRWSVGAMPPSLRLAEENFDPPDSATPGAPGSHRWVFKAISAGSGELRLELAARTPRVSPPRLFSVFVEVEPS